MLSRHRSHLARAAIFTETMATVRTIRVVSITLPSPLNKLGTKSRLKLNRRLKLQLQLSNLDEAAEEAVVVEVEGDVGQATGEVVETLRVVVPRLMSPRLTKTTRSRQATTMKTSLPTRFFTKGRIR